MAEQKQFGTHSVQVEGADTLILRLHGDLSEEEAIAIMADQLEFSEGKSHVLLVIDMTDFRMMTAGARRALATRGAGGPPRALVCFGANFRGRVLLELIVKAAGLLEGERSHVRVRWVKSEAEARACLYELRQLFTGHDAR